MRLLTMIVLSFILVSVSMISITSADDIYVAGGGSETSPYDTWAKAANTIQTGLGIAGAGDTVWVSNGVYVGEMGVIEGATNVVIVTNGVTLKSANGAEKTMIYGEQKKRCVYMSGSNTVLDGFTLTGGNIIDFSVKGGGAYCENYGLIENCTFTSNSASSGGGAYVIGSYVNNCLFETNRSTYSGGGLCVWEDVDDFGGFISNSVMRYNQAARGSGISARDALINDCQVYENRTHAGSYDGGGIYIVYSNSYVRNTMIYSNYCGRDGGGIFAEYNANIENCTIVDNQSGQYGGGIASRYGASIRNTIIYHNQGMNVYSNIFAFDAPYPTYDYCCVAPLTNDTACTDADPLVMVPSCSLLGSSPCIDAGTNMTWMTNATDKDGDPRIFNEIVDIGADETYVGSAAISGPSPLQIQWNVPQGAVCQWQTTTNLNGTWTDFAGAITASTPTISFFDSSGNSENHFRVIWEK